MRHRFLDRARRDLGEHHALQRLVADQAALAQDLGDVPADRLALAVRVGRQEQVVGALGGLGDRVDVLLVLVDDRVRHREAVVGVDRAFLRHQVAHVAVGGEDGEVLAEVLVDRLGLGGRLDDEEVLGHGGKWLRKAVSGRASCSEVGSTKQSTPADEPQAFRPFLFLVESRRGRGCQARRAGSGVRATPGRRPERCDRRSMQRFGLVLEHLRSPSRRRPPRNRAG